MKMNLGNINQITSAEYKFNVYDWDNDRGGNDKSLIGKVSINYERSLGFQGRDITAVDKDLRGMTENEIVQVFNDVFKTYMNIKFNGIKYTPSSIHVRNYTDSVFLFILGVKKV
jgi:hypothetical protein